MPTMQADKSFRLRQRGRLQAGDVFHVEQERDAAALERLQFAHRDDTLTPPPEAKAKKRGRGPDKKPRKRRPGKYQRRDMVAE